MKRFAARILFWSLFVLITSSALGLIFFWDQTLASRFLFNLQEIIDNSDALRDSILASSPFAPLYFIGLQILQVILAPVPGEASGFLGGYLFGAWSGFLLSSIGLAIGSGLAFAIGHLFADTLKERWTTHRIYRQYNRLIEKNNFVVPFILFLLPGFPKDLLSYLLGLSAMPMRVFIFIATLARMPGTLVLSLQGAQVYDKNYHGLLLLVFFSLAISLPCFYYRRRLVDFLLRHGT